MTKPLFIFASILVLILLFRLYFFYFQRTQYSNGQNLSFETTVISDSKFSGNYQNFSVNLPTGELVFFQTAAYP
jgi:hypothetical protein